MLLCVPDYPGYSFHLSPTWIRSKVTVMKKHLHRWVVLSESLLGRVAIIKMRALPRLLFLGMIRLLCQARYRSYLIVGWVTLLRNTRLKNVSVLIQNEVSLSDGIYTELYKKHGFKRIQHPFSCCGNFLLYYKNLDFFYFFNITIISNSAKKWFILKNVRLQTVEVNLSEETSEVLKQKALCNPCQSSLLQNAG